MRPPHAIVLGVLLSLSGASASTLGDAQTYLLSAERLYEELDYEGALIQIRFARHVSRSREQEITLLLYEGIMLAELNKWKESTAPFSNALALNAEAQLPVQASPKVQAHFESLRERLNRELAAQAALTPEPKPPPEEPKPSIAPPVEPPIKPANEPVSLPPQPPLSMDTPTPQRGPPRSYSLVPAIAGGSLMVAGGISWGLSRVEINRQALPCSLRRGTSV